MRPRQHGVAVGVELQHFEVSVGIDEQGKTFATDSHGYSRSALSVKIRG